MWAIIDFIASPAGFITVFIIAYVSITLYEKGAKK